MFYYLCLTSKIDVLLVETSNFWKSSEVTSFGINPSENIKKGEKNS